MNHTNTKSRNSLIQRIHVLKRDLLLNDETYCTILQSISGKDSCAAIDDEYLNIIKQQMEGMLNRMRTGSSLILVNAAEHRKIAKLGYLLKWSWNDIAGFCFKETKKKSTRNCTAAELGKIINGMIMLINDGLATGKLILSHPDLEDFLKYTQSRNHKITSPREITKNDTDKNVETLFSRGKSQTTQSYNRTITKSPNLSEAT